MIDTKELRQLAQAATPGPWVSQGRYIGTPRHMSYIGEVRDQCGNWSDTEKSRADSAFIAAANPAAVSELLDRLEAAEKDVILKEQVIDALGLELNDVAKEHDALRAWIAKMEKQEPVWFIDERGEPKKYHKSKADYCKYGGLDLLYNLPGAKGE